MYGIGLMLAVAGCVTIVLGIVILAAAAAKLVAGILPKRAGTSEEGVAINLPDVTKLIEALVKLPQWLLAILVGDVQVWLGTRLMANLPWWPT